MSYKDSETRDFSKPDYTYNVKVDRVVDGDTIDVYVDMGFYTVQHKRLRFLNVDTEELRSSDSRRRVLANEAKDRVQELLDMADNVYVQTKMDSKGKYGRLLAWVWHEKDGVMTNLNKQLVEEGFQKAPKLT